MKKRLKIGGYEVKLHPSGGFTVYGKEIHKRGRYISPREKVIADCNRAIEQGRRGFSTYLKTTLGYYGLFSLGKRSVAAGKQELGINGPFTETKRGRVKSGVRVPKRDIQNAIKDIWPQSQLDEWRDGEEVSFAGISDFREKFLREYMSAHNVRGGFRKVFESVYPQKIYPGVYDRISKRVYASTVNTEVLGEWFRSRGSIGLPVSQSYLRYSEDPEETLAYRQVLTLKKSSSRLLKLSFDDVVKEISGLRKEDIESCRGSRTPMANLSEELVHFFFLWNCLLGIPLGRHTPKGEIHKVGHERMFGYGEKDCQADMRIGDVAVEVKSGMARFKDKQLQDMLGRYTPNTNFWLTGEPITESSVVFHSKPVFYSHTLPRIKEAGIQVIEHEWFSEKLRQLIKSMKQTHADVIRDIRPRIQSLDYILALDHELVFSPFLLMRPSNRERREWSRDLLRNLSEKAKELQNVT